METEKQKISSIIAYTTEESKQEFIKFTEAFKRLGTTSQGLIKRFLTNIKL